MSLYRLTPAAVSRIVSGRTPAKAFACRVAAGGIHAGTSGSTSGLLEGMRLREAIDIASLTITLPPEYRPAIESVGPLDPATRVELCAHDLTDQAGDPVTFHTNRFFEADIPAAGRGAALARLLVARGLMAPVGSLTDVNTPAARNASLSDAGAIAA